jgi:hypothetical protein
MQQFSRDMSTFLDGPRRAWQWKFVPKDMPHSESTAHLNTNLRINHLRQTMSGCDDRLVIRGDCVLVMGMDEEDLLKWTTLVMFALQTKPWLKEVDLWKSFVNVDLGFLEGLEGHWLD